MSERAFAKVVPPMIAQLKHKFSISIIFQRKLPSEKRHKAEAAQHLIQQLVSRVSAGGSIERNHLAWELDYEKILDF